MNFIYAHRFIIETYRPHSQVYQAFIDEFDDPHHNKNFRPILMKRTDRYDSFHLKPHRIKVTYWAVVGKIETTPLETTRVTLWLVPPLGGLGYLLSTPYLFLRLLFLFGASILLYNSIIVPAPGYALTSLVILCFLSLSFFLDNREATSIIKDLRALITGTETPVARK